MVGLAVAFLGIMALLGPLLGEPNESSNLMAYGISAIALLVGIVAVVFVKPRVPERRPGQSLDAYWLDQNVASSAMLVWFLMEGAGILATIGFALTGHILTAVTMCLAIVVFWMTGPNAFARP